MRVLLLHASVGQGHKSAASAVAQALESLQPRPTIDVLDCLDLIPEPIAKVYNGTYEASVKRAAAAYGVAFRYSSRLARGPLLRPLRRAFHRAIDGRLIDAVRAFRPDVCLSTHFMPLDILDGARRHGLIDTRLACLVTDYGVHGYWVEPRTDRYFVAAPETALALARQGVAASKIAVTGLPVREGFVDPPGRDEARRRFDLAPERLTLAVMAGGLGMGPVAKVVRSLAPAVRARDGELIVLCGKSAELRAEVAAALTASGVRGRALGFTNEVPAILAAADLLVTKPGGLTTTEALAVGRPMLLYDAMPGQEEENARHHERCGVAVRMQPSRAGEALERLLAQPALLAGMQTRARALARPYAARTIAEETLALAPLDALRRLRGAA